MRLEALRGRPDDGTAVDQALLAHLCRCTGWQTIREAAHVALASQPAVRSTPWGGDATASARRAQIEGRSPQRVGPLVALGGGGFADDTAPAEALVAVWDGSNWVVGETLSEARRRAGKVQGRRTSAALRWPVDVPPGDWERTLQTTWVEPAYLEPDASWCVPGGVPVSPLANGGAFGGKTSTGVEAVARRLADEHGRPVRVLLAREDVVRLGPKRPPVAIGIRADGTGVMVVGRAGVNGIGPATGAGSRASEVVAGVAPGLAVVELDIPGPPTSLALRGALWVEAAVAMCSLRDEDRVVSPEGAVATATIAADGTVHVRVECGDALDVTVLRSYCIGAAHMALGWVRSEGIAVDEDGVVHDLTIRSFGILRAVDMPQVEVAIADGSGPTVNGSDAVFAAVAAAAWRAAGHPPRWPLARGRGQGTEP